MVCHRAVLPETAYRLSGLGKEPAFHILEVRDAQHRGVANGSLSQARHERRVARKGRESKIRVSAPSVNCGTSFLCAKSLLAFYIIPKRLPPFIFIAIFEVKWNVFVLFFVPEFLLSRKAPAATRKEGNSSQVK